MFKFEKEMVNSLFGKLGGIKNMSAMLELSSRQVPSNWKAKGGRIPVKYWPRLLEKTDVTLKELFEPWRGI